MMDLPRDFLLNLAASLAYDLLKAGTARLKTLALGEPAQRDLQACYRPLRRHAWERWQRNTGLSLYRPLRQHACERW